MRRPHVLSVLLFACLLTPAARASEPWSLSNLTQRALAGHPALRAADHAARAERARGRESTRWADPRLTFEMEDLPADRTEWGAARRTVTLGQALPAAGRGSRLRADAAAVLARAELERELAAGDLAHAVRLAWIEALVARRRTALAAASDGAARELLRVAERGQAAGAWGEVEVLAARAEAEAATLARQEADRQQTRALAALARWVQVPLAPEDVDPAQLEALPAASVARGESPEVRRARAVLAERRAHERLLEIAGRPEIELTAGLGWAPDTDERVLEAAVGLPLPLGPRRRDLREAAAEERLAAEAELEAAQRAAAADAEARRAEVDSARARVVAYGERLLPLARQSYATAQRSFEAGRSGWSVVLEARRALAQVEAGEIEAWQSWQQAAAEAARAGLDVTGD